MQPGIVCVVVLAMVCVVSGQLPSPNYRSRQGNVDLTKMLMSPQRQPLPMVPTPQFPVYPPPVRRPSYLPWNNLWELYLLDDILGTGFIFE